MRFTVVALALGATLPLAHIAQAAEEFRLGAVTSLTGGGAPTGAGALAAYKIAVEDINAQGGILGRKVSLVTGDTTTNPTQAVMAARRLIDVDKVDALIGPITSQEVIPVLELATAANLPHISTAASTLITPENGPLHFSTSVTTVNQVIPAIRHAIDKLGVKSFGIISDNGGMSKAGVVDVVEYLKREGLEPAAIQEFEFHAADVTPQLMSLRGANADALIFFGSLGDDARKLLENMLDIDWNVPVLGSLVMTNYAKGNAAIIGEEAFANVYSGNFATMSYCPSDPIGTSDYAKFVKGAYERIADLDRMGGAAALPPYYIQPMIMAAAINGAGTTDGKKVAEWIEANSDKIPALIGKLAASKDSHFLPSPEAIVAVKLPYAVREDGLLERADCKG